VRDHESLNRSLDAVEQFLQLFLHRGKPAKEPCREGVGWLRGSLFVYGSVERANASKCGSHVDVAHALSIHKSAVAVSDRGRRAGGATSDPQLHECV